jgi:cytochrome c biogenesis protein
LRRAVRPRLITDKKNILLLKINDSFGKNWSLAKTQEEFKKELSSRHYRLKGELKGNRAFFSARKRTLGLFGSDVVHLGLLFVLAGGIISGSGGIKDYLTLNEGQILPVLKADFKIRLDKFETEYHPNGSVRDWKSTLTVLENEESILSKVVEVNHPLSYKGYVFYQSGAGWDWSNPSFEIWVKKKKNPSFLKKKEIKIGEKTLLEGENLWLSALNFVPDFVIGENKQVVTRSLDPNNPAVLIEGWQEEEKIFSGWIFAKFPDFSRIHFVKEADYSFELRNFKGTPFSGIQASKDPGVNFIWLGCIVGLIGLSLAFYWPPREIKVFLEESHGKTEVAAGGIVSKNREAFQLEFEKIMTSLRRIK